MSDSVERRSIARAPLRVAGGILLLAVAVVLAVGAFGSDGLRGEVVDGGVPCPFLMTTGLVCPLCGMTRATVALGGGDLGGAFAAHPLFPVVLVFTCWGGYMIARGRRLRIGGRSVEVRVALAGVAVVWTINLVAQSM